MTYHQLILYSIVPIYIDLLRKQDIVWVRHDINFILKIIKFSDKKNLIIKFTFHIYVQKLLSIYFYALISGIEFYPGLLIRPSVPVLPTLASLQLLKLLISKLEVRDHNRHAKFDFGICWKNTITVLKISTGSLGPRPVNFHFDDCTYYAHYKMYFDVFTLSCRLETVWKC